MNRIKELRARDRIRQKDLSTLLSVSQATLSNWESGTYDVDLDSLQKLADYFNVSTDYLLGRTDEHSPPGMKKEAATDNPLLRAYELATDRDKRIVDQVLEPYFDHPPNHPGL